MGLLDLLSPSGLIASIAGSIGGKLAESLVQAHKDSLDAENSDGRTKADLAARELTLQTREAELSNQLRIAQIGKWYEPEHLMAYILFAHMAKIVVWDTMLGLGSTPALHGDFATWEGMIMVFLFGKRGIENVVRILKK